METQTDKPQCGKCGATSNIWKTCVGDRCGSCGCDAERHGPHEYDYEYNRERRVTKPDGTTEIRTVGHSPFIDFLLGNKAEGRE